MRCIFSKIITITKLKKQKKTKTKQKEKGKKRRKKKKKFNRPINYGIYWRISEEKVISYGTNVFRQSKLNETKTW